jgi:ubiquinone biosynthesis protein
MTQEQLVGEIQKVIKALLGYGARLPKILMLYVKNLMFLDGAIARLAPNLDILGEFANLSIHMATTYGDHIAADLGVDATDLTVDPEAIKAQFGIVDPEMAELTYADLQARRDVIRRRLTGK